MQYQRRKARLDAVRGVANAVSAPFPGSTPNTAADSAVSEFSRWASGYTGADRAEWPLWVLGAKLVRASFRENVGPGVDDLAGCDSLKYALHRYPELVVATDATMVLSLFTKFPRPLLDRSLLRSLLSELSFDEEDATNLHDSLFSDPIPDFPSAPGGDRMAWTRVAAVILRGPDPVFQSATHFMSTVDAICAKYGASVAPDGSPKFYLKHFSQYRCNAPRRIAHLLSLVRKKANFGQNLRTLVFNAHFFLDKSMANTLVADPAASTEATERAMCTFLDVSPSFWPENPALAHPRAALAPLMEQFASCFSEIHPDEGIPVTLPSGVFVPLLDFGRTAALVVALRLVLLLIRRWLSSLTAGVLAKQCAQLAFCTILRPKRAARWPWRSLRMQKRWLRLGARACPVGPEG